MENLRRLFKSLVPEKYLDRGLTILKSQIEPIRILLEQRKVPDEGWTDEQIKVFLKLLSSLDTDKDPKAARVGEREARIASPLISDLATGFCHGIGRGGELAAAQPKAPGTSILYKLANQLANL